MCVGGGGGERSRDKVAFSVLAICRYFWGGHSKLTFLGGWVGWGVGVLSKFTFIKSEVIK